MENLQLAKIANEKEAHERVKEVRPQMSVIVTNIDNQNKIYYNPTIPTIKYQITQ